MDLNKSENESKSIAEEISKESIQCGYCESVMESSFAEIYEILRQGTKILRRVNEKKKPKNSEAQVQIGDAGKSTTCSDLSNTDLPPKQKKKCHYDKSIEECGTQNKKPKKNYSLQELINVISDTSKSKFSVNSSETENALHKKKKKRRNTEPSTFEQSKEWTEFQMHANKQEPSESTPIKSNNVDIPRTEKRKRKSEEIPRKQCTKRDSEASISEEIGLKKSKCHISNEETQEKTVDKSIFNCSSKEEIQSPIKKKKKRHKSNTLSFEESCSDHKKEKHKGCTNEDEKKLHENYQNLILSDLNKEIQTTLNKKKKKKRHKSKTLYFEKGSKDKQETHPTEDRVELQENAGNQKAANSVWSDSIETNQSGLKKLNKYETSSFEERCKDNESCSIGHGKKLHVNTITLNSMLSNSSKEESSKGNKKHMIKNGIEFQLSTTNQIFPDANLDVSKKEDIPSNFKKKKKKRHKSETLIFEESNEDSKYILIDKQMGLQVKQKPVNTNFITTSKGEIPEPETKKKKKHKNKTPIYEKSNIDGKELSPEEPKGFSAISIKEEPRDQILSKSTKNCNKKQTIEDGIKFQLSTTNRTFVNSNLDVSREENIPSNFKKKKKKRHKRETLIFEESNEDSKYLTAEKLTKLQVNAMKQESVDPILVTSSKDDILEPEKKKKKTHKNKIPIFEKSNQDEKQLAPEEPKEFLAISIKEEPRHQNLSKAMKNCSKKQMIEVGIEFQLSITNGTFGNSNLDASREQVNPSNFKKKKKERHRSKTLILEESNGDDKYLATEKLMELQVNAMKQETVDSNLITSSKDKIVEPEKKKHKNKILEEGEGLLAIPIQEEPSGQILTESAKNIIQTLLQRKKKKRCNTESLLREEISEDIEKPDNLIDEQNVQVSGEEIQPPSKKKRKKHKNSEIAIPEDVIKSKKKHEKKAKFIQSIELLDMKMKEETLPNAETKISLHTNIETPIELPTVKIEQEKIEETKESIHKKTEIVHSIESTTTKIEDQLVNKETNKPRTMKERLRSWGTKEVVADEKMFKTTKSDTKHRNKASTSQNEDINNNDSPNHIPSNIMKSEDALENILNTVEPTKISGISSVKDESLNEDVEILNTAPPKEKKRKTVTRGPNGILKPTQNSDLSKEEFDDEEDLLDSLIKSNVAAKIDDHSEKEASKRNSDSGVNKKKRSTEYYCDENDIEDYQNQMLESLDFVLPFEPPTLHQFSNLLGRHKGTQRKVLEDMKLVVKKGKFSKEEDDIIKRNWKEFCKTQYLPDDPAPFVNLVFCWNAGRSSSLSKDSSRKFLQFLARDLNTRMLGTVYGRFQTICCTDRFSNFSLDEDKKILNFMKTHADDRAPYSTLGRLLNRNRRSVHKRHTALVKMEHVKKCSENVVEEPTAQNIVKWLMKVTKCRKVIELKDRKISKAEWDEVGKKVGLLSESLRKRWKYPIYVRLFSTDRDITEIKKKFVDLLCKDGADDFRTIDYNSYAKKYFENLTGSYLNILLRNMKRYLPSESRNDLPKCLKYLKENYLPVCRKSYIETISVPGYEEKEVVVTGESVSETDEEGSDLEVPRYGTESGPDGDNKLTQYYRK